VNSTTPTINTYVSDMLALERHILQPIQTQLSDNALKSSPAAVGLLRDMVSLVEAHIEALEARLNVLGGHSGSPLKSGVSSVMGAVAAAIDNVRKTEVSKDLRDDYTALCLGSISYTMLHTTARGLHDQLTADLAKRHLQDYATLIMRLSAIMPSVVLTELRELGVPVDAALVGEARQEEENAWKSAAHATVGVP
jgi:hypothetical protein